jgi:hypothetical protein
VQESISHQGHTLRMLNPYIGALMFKVPISEEQKRLWRRSSTNYPEAEGEVGEPGLEEGGEEEADLDLDQFLAPLAHDQWEIADILRHICGNPFRPYPAPPSWHSVVVTLASALYAGEDCSFALHDALLESGHPELAEHFREKNHPKGCWVVDQILGKA